MSTLTDNIRTVEVMLDSLIASLEASDNITWSVEKFSGTSYAKLFEFLPTVQPPCCIVVWQGARMNLEPGRPQRIYHDVSVLVLANDPQGEEGAKTARELVMEVLDIADDRIDGNMLYRAQSVSAIDLSEIDVAPNTSCYNISFEVSDH